MSIQMKTRWMAHAHGRPLELNGVRVIHSGLLVHAAELKATARERKMNNTFVGTHSWLGLAS